MKIDDGVLVYAPKMNDTVADWGVYAIPRMWRAKDGELVIRFNGEKDCADINNMFCLPNLYFVSNTYTTFLFLIYTRLWYNFNKKSTAIYTVLYFKLILLVLQFS